MLNGERLVWISDIKALEGLTEMALGNMWRKWGRQPCSYLGEKPSRQKQQEALRTWGRSKPTRFVQGACRELVGWSSKSNGKSRIMRAWRGNKTRSGRDLAVMVNNTVAFTSSEMGVTGAEEWHNLACILIVSLWPWWRPLRKPCKDKSRETSAVNNL